MKRLFLSLTLMTFVFQGEMVCAAAHDGPEETQKTHRTYKKRHHIPGHVDSRDEKLGNDWWKWVSRDDKDPEILKSLCDRTKIAHERTRAYFLYHFATHSSYKELLEQDCVKELVNILFEKITKKGHGFLNKRGGFYYIPLQNFVHFAPIIHSDLARKKYHKTAMLSYRAEKTSRDEVNLDSFECIPHLKAIFGPDAPITQELVDLLKAENEKNGFSSYSRMKRYFEKDDPYINSFLIARFEKLMAEPSPKVHEMREASSVLKKRFGAEDERTKQVTERLNQKLERLKYIAQVATGISIGNGEMDNNEVDDDEIALRFFEFQIKAQTLQNQEHLAMLQEYFGETNMDPRSYLLRKMNQKREW